MNNTFDCAEACKACHDICSVEVTKLMARDAATSLDDKAIEVLIQCASICQTANRVLRDRKAFADAIRLTCATVCEKCANLLAPHIEMQDCVASALKCAECCRKVD